MQRSRVSHHPCHRLSVPSAKRFWCRHCMMVFEDAITRWRHSRSCRSGGFDNHVRRREIETQSLQKMAETLDPDMVTQITVPREDGSSKDLCCFICRQRFVSLDEMREHVKYPCNKPSSAQRNPLPLNYFPEPTFGTGIQQHYTDGPVLQSYNRAQQASSSASTSDPQAVTVYMNEGDQHDSEAKPTNIYVNENGETVIEVENLDLNTKSGELSLAHLLTQLSQQGIVFDQQPQGGETEVVTSPQEHQVVQDSVSEVDFSQPTAVDAANTLTQLAGSAFRAVNNAQETYVPPVKRIKTEEIELQYQQLEQPQYQLEQPAHPAQVQTYMQKEEPYVEEPSEKYIICTNESDVIRVVRANDVPPEDSSGTVAFQNGDSGPNDLQNTLAEGEVEQQTVLIQGRADSSSQPAGLQEAGNASAENSLTGSQMIVLQHGETQIITPAGQVIKTEGGSSQIVVEEQNPSIVQQPVELRTVTAYASQEGSVAVMGPADSVAVMEQQGTVGVMEQQGTVEILEQQGSVGMMEQQGTVAVAQPEDTVAVMEQQGTVAVMEQEGTVAVLEQEGSVAVLEQEGTVAVVEQEGSVAVVEQEGSVAVMEQQDTVEMLEQQGSVAVIEQQDTVAVMQPEGTVAVMHQEGTVAVMEQEGTVAVVQPEGTVAVMQPEGTVAVVQQEGTVAVMEQEGTVAVMEQEGTVAVMEEHIDEEGQVAEKGKPCLVMPANSEEVSTTLASDSAVTGLLEMSGVAAAAAAARDSQQAVVTEPESALLLPQIVSVTSASTSDDVPQLVQQPPTSE